MPIPYSLVSPEEKTSWQDELQNLHETFARPVVIYKHPERIEIVSSEDYISTYRNQHQGENLTYDTVPVSGSFMMRIHWQDPSKVDLGIPLQVPVQQQLVKLKMRQDAYDFLGAAHLFYVDGIACELVGSQMPHGLFSIDFYTMFARRRDMQ